MKIYKNLLFAYSFEIMVGLTTTLLIIFWDHYAIGFLAFFGIRPLILKTREISIQDNYWFVSYQLIKCSVFVISFLIIILYIIYKLFLEKDFLFLYRDRIITLFPLLLLVHGILGLVSQKKSQQNI